MYANQIIALLTFKLKLETIHYLLVVTDKALVRNNNVSTKVGVGGSNEFEVNKVESQKKIIKFKKQVFKSALLVSEVKVLIL